MNLTLHKGVTMADDRPDMEFEDIPLEEARLMGRGPRMEPLLYDTLRTKIQALSTEATRIRLGPEIQPARMKNYLLRIARELNVPVMVRKVSGGSSSPTSSPSTVCPEMVTVATLPSSTASRNSV